MTRPDAWSSPRPVCDASQRYATYGALQPAEDHPWRGQFWRQLGVAVLVPLAVALVVLAAVAGGWV